MSPSFLSIKIVFSSWLRPNSPSPRSIKLPDTSDPSPLGIHWALCTDLSPGLGSICMLKFPYWVMISLRIKDMSYFSITVPLDTPQRQDLISPAHLCLSSPTCGSLTFGHSPFLPALILGGNDNNSFPSHISHWSMTVWLGMITEIQGDAYRGASGNHSPQYLGFLFPFCSQMSPWKDTTLVAG